jgi:IMP dehydrogenase/GMP reductase
MKVISGLTYDDVLLIPKKSSIQHRADIDLSVDWGYGINTLPIVCANMKHVINHNVAMTLSQNKCMSLLHRFETPDERIASFAKIVNSGYEYYIGTSFGANKEEIEIFKRFVSEFSDSLNIVCIDIAHGHSDVCLNAIKEFKNIHPGCLLIAGNVATSDGAYDLWKAGADVVKCGIGNGCFAAGTRILMSNGLYKNIEDVKEGDRIINKDGKPKTVLKSFSTGTKRVSKLKNSCFYKETIVTRDHNYWVANLTSKKIEWKEIRTSNNVKLLLPQIIEFELPKTFNFEIKGFDELEIGFDLEPSYELGYLIGTSLLTYISVKTYSDNCINKLMHCGLTVNEQNNLNSYLYADFFDIIGKKIPENILVDNKDYLQGLLDGLKDSGCFRHDETLELFNIVNYLLNGEISSKIKTVDDYQLFEFEFDDNEFETETFDLTIDDDTHSFIADNAIVHNSSCSTRIETGHGVPQLTALDDIWSYFQSNQNRPKIIADGGLSKVSNIVKTLCLSDGVMLGNMLAGTLEGPGDIIEKDGKKYKIYAGSSTFKANNVEGYSGLVPYKGSMNVVLQKIKEGIQSGCSYQGVTNVNDLKKDPVFVKITNAGLIESGAHDLVF